MPFDDELQRYLKEAPIKMKRQLAFAIKAEADRLKEAIQAAAPVKTGALRDSVKVRRKRNDLELEVTAGGDATTRYYDRSTGYEKEVVIDGRDNRGIAKRQGGAGVGYDYALGTEYGTSKEPAQPFFYTTARAMQNEIRDNIAAAVEEALK